GLTHLSRRVFDGGGQLVASPRDLFLGNSRRGCNEDVVATIGAGATLHRLHQQPTVDGRLSYQVAEIYFRRKWRLGFLVGDKLNRPQQTQAAYVANDVRLQVLQPRLEYGRNTVG